jgi:hypothetical protein
MSKSKGGFGNSKTRIQRAVERAHAFVNALAQSTGSVGTQDPNVRPPTSK